MISPRAIVVVTFAVIVTLALVQSSTGSPAFDVMGGLEFLGVCIRNCAQCKKMYGAYFEGQMCADACVKYKGKIIPDCEDIGSIAPFLNKFE